MTLTPSEVWLADGRRVLCASRSCGNGQLKLELVYRDLNDLSVRQLIRLVSRNKRVHAVQHSKGSRALSVFVDSDSIELEGASDYVDLVLDELLSEIHDCFTRRLPTIATVKGIRQRSQGRRNNRGKDRRRTRA